MPLINVLQFITFMYKMLLLFSVAINVEAEVFLKFIQIFNIIEFIIEFKTETFVVAHL